MSHKAKAAYVRKLKAIESLYRQVRFGLKQLIHASLKLNICKSIMKPIPNHEWAVWVQNN